MSVEIINDDCLNILKNIRNVDLIITDPPYFVIPKGKKQITDMIILNGIILVICKIS